ncbi:Flocculation protein FLO11-like [Caenorhabditis elegans]|uniref:Flocculation protein FLO11-like n=1 Tax=Caenorhabditis elegans TaxID=6239 RepID=P91481_CAEEL|nr:Flocculation protein FLO11-like [Caenorhabditis elegans]CCD67785.1 Flocculation protein FLO11-like [Caenorhabditis elegans]|eukprot:NP_491265.2 Uncharacterized protein CELE_T20F5.5 [Caenorhabditis elegans]
MNKTLVSTTTASNTTINSADLRKELDKINETLSSISAKEVLFIITLSFLAVFAAVNMCLLILERRKKKKQNSVPQSIVIQPNNAKPVSKPGKSDKSKVSSGYEKDVLPSKSMKMKVSISPDKSASKKLRVPSKESEDTQPTKSDASQTEKSTKKPPVTLVESSADVTTAVESISSQQQLAPAAPVAPPQLTQASPAPVAPAVLVPEKEKTADKSQSNDSSMTSFTVPEEATFNRSKSQSTAPKEPTPATPTATTLSGTSYVSTTGTPEAINVITAKDVTQVKSPMSPMPSMHTPEAARTTEIRPISPALPSAAPLLVITTPPPNSEKKI